MSIRTLARMAAALAGLLFLGTAGGASVDRIAATVNDVAIPESEVRRAMAVSALRPEGGETSDALRFGPAVPDAAEVEVELKKLRDRIAREGKNPAAEFAAAGLTTEEVRATVERQLIIQRYLQERFRPIAFADEDRAREEYEKNYAPERKAAGLSVPAFETVSEEMRARSQQRVFGEEVEKWMKELREKARIATYRIPIPAQPGRTSVFVSTAVPQLSPTPKPSP